MYNNARYNTIAVSECVKNYKENLIFIDKELKMGKNILLKTLIINPKLYKPPNKTYMKQNRLK